MKSIAIAAGLLIGLAMTSSKVAAQAAEDAVGVWLNPENQSNVEFYRCGEGLCGKITKLAAGGAPTNARAADSPAYLRRGPRSLPNRASFPATDHAARSA